MEDRNWQIFEIPLGEDVYKGLGDIGSFFIFGDLKGTVYLDDIRLVAAGPTAVDASGDGPRPGIFSLDQNYPNPFNSDTIIHFSLPTSGPISLAIYNLLGQRVATLVDGMHQGGAHALRWNGRDDQEQVMASGVYLYKLQAGAQVETRKLLLVR